MLIQAEKKFEKQNLVASFKSGSIDVSFWIVIDY